MLHPTSDRIVLALLARKDLESRNWQKVSGRNFYMSLSEIFVSKFVNEIKLHFKNEKFHVYVLHCRQIASECRPAAATEK